MGSKTVFYTLETDQPIAQVRDALKRSLIFLGGMVFEQGNGYEVKKGANGVNFAFTADFVAYVELRQPATNKYEFFANINWTPSVLVWICLVVGFFVFGILWIVPLFYLFIDPSQAYQQALFRVQGMITTQSAPVIPTAQPETVTAQPPLAE